MAENKPIYEFLDQQGVTSMAKGILEKVNVRIAQRIVQQLDYSDTTHVPSAAAVLRAINAARHTTIQTVTGDINEQVPLEQRSTDVLYLQRDTVEDTTWMMYIWNANPELHPDPDGEWINIGDTEIDLSGYWSKSEADMADLANQLGIPNIVLDIDNLKGDVAGIRQDITTINGNIDAINTDLEKKLYRDDVAGIPNQTIINIIDNAESETDPFAEPVATPAAAVEAMMAALAEGKNEVSLKIAANMDMRVGDLKTIEIPAGMDATIAIPENVKVTVSETSAFKVNDGAKLTLAGSGTIVKTSKKAQGAITVDNGGELTINGITIDGTTQGFDENWVYGVYAKNSSVINFKSGVIKVGPASCIGTNNTTGGSTINISGGALYAEGGYAIYNASQGTINVTGGIVQGIQARMGTINISGEAQIIGTTITEDTRDAIGANIKTTGSLYLGDTIALIAGTYTDPNGVDIAVNIGGNARVESEFRAAVGVYTVDTKEAANVTVEAAVANNVSTSDISSAAFKVYDHAYIAADAEAHGKTYAPTVESTVTITVEDHQIYPVVTE